MYIGHTNKGNYKFYGFSKYFRFYGIHIAQILIEYDVLLTNTYQIIEIKTSKRF